MQYFPGLSTRKVKGYGRVKPGFKSSCSSHQDLVKIGVAAQVVGVGFMFQQSRRNFLNKFFCNKSYLSKIQNLWLARFRTRKKIFLGLRSSFSQYLLEMGLNAWLKPKVLTLKHFNKILNLVVIFIYSISFSGKSHFKRAGGKDCLSKTLLVVRKSLQKSPKLFQIDSNKQKSMQNLIL